MNILKKIGPHLIALATFTVITCVYFFPQFDGKVLQQGDLIQFQGMAHETIEYYEETGHRALWTNSMFSGMPTYQIHSWPNANKISWLERALNLYIPRPAGYFIFAQIAFYILLLVLGVNHWLAIGMSVAFAFTTNNFQLYEAGHTSKLRTLFSVPIVLGGMVLALRKKYLVGGILFCAGLTLNVFTNHFQITYYIAICLGILYLIELVRAIREKTLQTFARATGVLAVGAFLAFLSSAYNLWATFDYSQETMRGKPTLTDTAPDPSSSSQVEGLAWEYAMQWSNGTEDLLAGLIPRAAGGSSGESVPDDTEWARTLRQMGVSNQGAPLYWGALPFTSGPAYFGASILLLCVLSVFVLRGHMKWWLVGMIIFTALLSMGKHFAVLNQFLFDYFPLFNKFRAPSSILTVTALFIPILAALGLSAFFKAGNDPEKLRKALLTSYGILGGLTLAMALLGTGLFNFSHPSDGRYAQIADVLITDRKALFQADAWRSFLFISAITAILYAALRGWIRKYWLAGTLLGFVVLIDLWGVDRRYIAPGDFIPERQLESAFTPDPADLEIMKDKDPHYRVHDVTVQAFQNSHRAYFHHMIGGYHAAKLQRYQDIIDRYLSKGNQYVLNMLNTRYLITTGEEGDNPIVHRNPEAYGNAWFVENIKMVNTAEEEIEALEYLDARAQLVVHQEFEHLVSGFDPVKRGTISLKSYAPDKLVYQSSSEGDQIAVFSEVWYGPDKGWKCYIDGQPAELFRADYILRAVNVPRGDHEIVMEFNPARYHTLETVAMVASILVILGLIYLAYRGIMGMRKEETASEPEDISFQQKPVKKAKSKKRGT